MSRVALKDFTFSNGVVIPAGTTVAIPMYAVHHDESIWPDPFKFDPYRSSRMRQHDVDDVKQQMVTPTTEFLPWGYGRHAWYVVSYTSECQLICNYCSPGRFFAVNELKTMLAHVEKRVRTDHPNILTATQNLSSLYELQGDTPSS